MLGLNEKAFHPQRLRAGAKAKPKRGGKDTVSKKSASIKAKGKAGRPSTSSVNYDHFNPDTQFLIFTYDSNSEGVCTLSSAQTATCSEVSLKTALSGQTRLIDDEMVPDLNELSETPDLCMCLDFLSLAGFLEHDPGNFQLKNGQPLMTISNFSK